MARKKVDDTQSRNRRLSPQQRVELFVTAYLKHFNASRAYSACFGGLEGPSLHTVASTFLRADDTQKYLTQKLKERQAELRVDQTYVVNKLLDIVEADYTTTIQLLTQEQIDRIPEAIKPLIQSVEVDKTFNSYTDADGNEKTSESKKYKVTFMSKDKALDALGKHTGAYMKDNVQGNYDLGKMSWSEALKELNEVKE